ncbi:paraquat-inducible protein A [Planctomycetota bacterium]|nr:paraquat-inducible protein A [Planctomycetota bacterium]
MPPSTNQPPTTLHRQFPKHSKYIIALWATSLICNIIALTTPFMQVNLAFSPTHIYSLPHSVKLMWQAHLYIVAILILGFSILFPLIKLILIAITWLIITSPQKQNRYINTLEKLGKWSMLDIFVVCILLVLTNDQVVISSTIHYGVYFFLIAITLSMTTSLIIQNLIHNHVLPHTTSPSDHSQLICPARLAKNHNIPILILWFIALFTLIAAVGIPFFRIEGFFFNQHAFSIFKTSITLFESKIPVLAIFIFITLILTPFAYLIALIILWLGELTPHTYNRYIKIADTLYSWSMLDVFGFALIVFLLEGRSLIKTAIKPGLYLLTLAIIITLTTAYLVTFLRNKYIKQLKN